MAPWPCPGRVWYFRSSLSNRFRQSLAGLSTYGSSFPYFGARRHISWIAGPVGFVEVSSKLVSSACFNCAMVITFSSKTSFLMAVSELARVATPRMHTFTIRFP